MSSDNFDFYLLRFFADFLLAVLFGFLPAVLLAADLLFGADLLLAAFLARFFIAIDTFYI